MTIAFDKLKVKAQEAIDTKNISLAWRIFGQSEMAYECNRITWSQMNELTNMLIDNGVEKWKGENV